MTPRVALDRARGVAVVDGVAYALREYAVRGRIYVARRHSRHVLGWFERRSCGMDGNPATWPARVGVLLAIQRAWLADAAAGREE